MARRDVRWGLAFLSALLLPWMLIFARAGIEVTCGIIGLMFLWHSARERDWGWLRVPFARIAILAWLWLVLVVTPLAVDSKAGLSDAVMWFRLPLLLLALRYYVLRTHEARLSLAWMLVLMLLLVAMDSLVQYATGVSLTGHARLASLRLTGPFTNPKVGVFMGKMLLPAAALLVASGIAARKRMPVWVGLALCMLVVGVILLSGERSALLSTLLGMASIAGLMMLAEKRLRVPCILAGIAGVAAMGLLYTQNDWVHLRGDQAVEVMAHYWQSDYGLLSDAALTMAKEYPLHGVGLGGFRKLCPPLDYNGAIFRGLHPHNAFLEWLVEAGVPGLLLFVALLFVLAREAWRQWRAQTGLAGLLPAAMLGALVQHFFPLLGMQSIFSNWSAMLVWYTLGVMAAGLPLTNTRK